MELRMGVKPTVYPVPGDCIFTYATVALFGAGGRILTDDLLLTR